MDTKIHTEEVLKGDIDNNTIPELQEMIGWVDAPDEISKTWDVTMMNEGVFTCENQETAQIIASLEEVKAILLRKNGN